MLYPSGTVTDFFFEIGSVTSNTVNLIRVESGVHFVAFFFEILSNSTSLDVEPVLFLSHQEGQISVLPFIVQLLMPAGLSILSPDFHFPFAA